MMMSSRLVLAGCIVGAMVGLALAEESDGFVLLPPEQAAEAKKVAEACTGNSDKYFSVGAMFVGFREAVEACVIISVMVNMLNKTGMPHLRRYIWYGVGAGVIFSCIIGGGIVGAYYAAKSKVMSPKDQAAFSGVFSLVAGLFLSILGIQFLRFKDIEEKYKRKLKEGFEASRRLQEEEAAASGVVNTQQVSTLEESDVANAPNVRPVLDVHLRKTAYSLMTLCFVAVLREGLESFVFLAAVGSNTPPAAVAIGALTGILLGCIFGYLVLITGKCMRNFRVFLALTTTFIMFIAAGLIALSASAFKTVALIDIGRYDTDFLITRELYNIYTATGDGNQQCGFFAVLRAIFGYTHNPSLLWWLVYLGYWMIVLGVIGWRMYRGTLYSATGGNPFLEQEEDLELGSSVGTENGKEHAVVQGVKLVDADQSMQSTFAFYKPPTMPLPHNYYPQFYQHPGGPSMTATHPVVGMPLSLPAYPPQPTVNSSQSGGSSDRLPSASSSSWMGPPIPPQQPVPPQMPGYPPSYASSVHGQ